jgi:hypothetical protein
MGEVFQFVPITICTCSTEINWICGRSGPGLVCYGPFRKQRISTCDRNCTFCGNYQPACRSLTAKRSRLHLRFFSFSPGTPTPRQTVCLTIVPFEKKFPLFYDNRRILKRNPDTVLQPKLRLSNIHSFFLINLYTCSLTVTKKSGVFNCNVKLLYYPSKYLA